VQTVETNKPGVERAFTGGVSSEVGFTDDKCLH